MNAALRLLKEQDIDGDLRDEVAKRLNHTAQQERAAANIDDEPRMGRLKQSIALTGNFGLMDDDFQRLTESNKGTMLRMLMGEKRSRHNRWKAQQEMLDQAKLASFLALPYHGEPGKDQATVNIDEMLADTTDRTRNVAKAHQNRRLREVDKGMSQSFVEFNRTAKALAATVPNLDGLSGGKVSKDSDAANFLAYMSTEWERWQQENTDKTRTGPSIQETREMAAKALMYGQEAKGMFDFTKSNMFAFEAALEGTEFSAEGFEDNEGNKLLMQELNRLQMVKPTAGEAVEIPEADRKLIIEAFRKQKIDPTDEQIRQRYLKVKGAR